MVIADQTRHQRRSKLDHTTEILETELRIGAVRRSREPLERLLDRLSDVGFSWRDIARVVGISVPALRKWRLGGRATGENRGRLATLVSFCEVARTRCHVSDVAGWLETPLHSDAPVTGIDLIAGGRFDLALRLARDQGSDPEAVLDAFEPGWREHYASTVEVFAGPDRMPGLRMSDR